MSDQKTGMSHGEAKADAKAAKARAKAMRPWYKKKRFIIPLLLVIVIIAIVASSSGGGDDDTNTSSNSSSESSSDSDDSSDSESGGDGEPVDQESYGVGETGTSSDFELTLHTVEDPMVPANEFDTPSEGNRYVAVEIEAKNLSNERQTLSTLIGAEVMDSENRPYDIALAGVDRPQLDGEVQPGQSRRGWMVFEVPADATGLTLRLKGSLTADGVLFRLS